MHNISIRGQPCLMSRSKALFLISCAIILIKLSLSYHRVDAAAARAVVEKKPNQYFLNEFCDLQSKTIRNARKFRQENDTHLFLSSKNTNSFVRVLPQRAPAIPSSIQFGFGRSGGGSMIKQLNCSIVVVAPKSHGLLLNVNSVGLPKNLTKLSITLNYGLNHSYPVDIDHDKTSSQYLLTQDGSSKMAIHLQSFKPIDWSHVSFDILFTVYRKANNTGCPNKKWFDCGDNICVPASLVCDGNRNCPNGNDEMMFSGCYSSLFWAIAACSALALVAIIAVVTIALTFRGRQNLNRLNSLSGNALTADGDLNPDISSSKYDLTQESANQSSSYLKSNLCYSGFENPICTNGTLTKQHNRQTTTSSNDGHQDMNGDNIRFDSPDITQSSVDR